MGLVLFHFAGDVIKEVSMYRLKNQLFSLVIVLLCFYSWNIQADVLEEVLKQGTVRIGVSLFAPWTMRDQNNDLRGFEIDVAKKLADDMGVTPEYKVYQWEDIIPALEKREIDVIIAGMAITPARALRVTFTRPYADSGIALATNIEKTKDVKKLEELNQESIVVAVVAETVSVKFAKKLFDKAQVKAFKTSKEAKQAVVDGTAHAYVASMPQPRFVALEHPEQVDVPLAEPLLSYKAGMAINKGEPEWLNFLNAWITAREADHWLSASHKYWFDSLQWRMDKSQ